MSVIVNTLTSPSTMLNNSKKVAVDSNGVVYMCYYSTVGSYTQIFVKQSTDGGNTWTDTGFPQIANYNQTYPSIVVDSSNKVHVVWQGGDATNGAYNQIKYSNYASGVWSAWTNLQTLSGYYQYCPNIIIDSNGKLHVAWQGSDSVNTGSNYQIKYSNNVSGSWSTWINVSIVNNYPQYYPAMAFDTNNKLHIAWMGYDSSSTSFYQIKYSNNTSGSWSAWVNIQTITGYTQGNPSLVVDSNNKIHVVWLGEDSTYTTVNQIKYSNYTVGGAWSSWVNIQPISGYTQVYPSLSIDSNNKLHVVWAGTDSGNTTYAQIKYSNNISGTWSAWVNKTSGTTFNYQNPSCVYYKKLYCVYNGSTTIETFNISFFKCLIQDKNSALYTYNGTSVISSPSQTLNDTNFITNGFTTVAGITSTMLSPLSSNAPLKLLLWTDDISKTSASMVYNSASSYRPIDLLSNSFDILEQIE